jgi:hypothetical protein
MHDTAREAAVTPQAAMMRLLFGKQLTASLGAVARLGVADHMSDEPQPVEDLAAKVGADAPSLYRVMRMLAAFGVFREEKGKRFALTPVGLVLQTDAPGSMRYTAMMLGDDWAIKAYAHITDSIRTGGDAFTAAFGKQVFEWFADHPEKAETFQRAMTNGSANAAQAILSAYDYTVIKRIADIGGGQGFLLASILNRYPAMQGVLFDLPEVAAGVPPERLAECGGRLTVESGSFFERVPQGCDAYMMKHILHDWSDEHCRTILRLVREQLPRDGRLLVYELVLSDDPGPTPAKMLDIEMLVMTVGGRERTPEEFSDLFGSAGLKLERIVKTPGPICVIEGRPV